jgi:asparagine synthase (glutamine-hydrolysing)
MSGIAVILHRDGEPVNPRPLRALIDALAHRGDGDAAIWHEGEIGLAQQLRPTTRDATRERGLRADGFSVRIAFDGRLDNRDELIEALADYGATRDATDADLVRHAWARWTASAPERLFGDFAFALWDPRARRLFCARDILGMRPLCYSVRGATLALASEAHALVRARLASDAVNEGMAGEYLATTVLSRTDTLFRDVSRLAPAHLLSADPSGVRVARYWHPDPTRTIRYARDDDYADHLRELFRDAVRRKLRTGRRVGVMLSGGLDSSAVLGAAASLAGPDAIRAFTASFPGLDCDETPFSAEMTAHAGVDADIEPVEAQPPEWFHTQAERFLDVPDAPNGAMFEGLKARAAARGVNVLLFGCGGDEWFTGSVFRYGDWLRQGRLWRIARQVPLDARTYGWRRSVYLATRVGMWPTAPKRVRLVVRRLLGREGRTPRWLEPRFADRIDLADRLAWELPEGFASFAQADIFRTGTSGINVHSDEMEDRSAARAGLEQRYPFYDRRLIEFALAIPEDQRCRGVYEKYVLRNAVRPWVPDRIRARLGKAEFSDPYVRALRTLGGARAFRALRAADLGWIDGACLSRMYAEMERLHAAGSPRYRWLTEPLWAALSIELWLGAVWPTGMTWPEPRADNVSAAGVVV